MAGVSCYGRCLSTFFKTHVCGLNMGVRCQLWNSWYNCGWVTSVSCTSASALYVSTGGLIWIRFLPNKRCRWKDRLKCVYYESWAHRYDTLCRDYSVYASSQWEMALQCNIISHWLDTCTMCMLPANERWRYNVTPSLIGWTHAQNDGWIYPIQYACCLLWLWYQLWVIHVFCCGYIISS